MEKYIVLPLDLNPTSIGQILSRFYVIVVDMKFGCFSELRQELHLFVESDKNGLKEENKPFPKQKNWKPQKYKKLEFNKLKKYEYKPHDKIRFRNEFKL